MVRFHASDMILALNSDAFHHSEPGSTSRASGHFCMTNKGTKDFDNGTMVTLSKIIKYVMGSTGESEMASLYYNCKNTVQLETNLGEIGHKRNKSHN